ncbi:SsgA family sporulation/cell division regulator [Streptomyces flavofungini]|uniref:SsgA family sporulation/cell division regulator n=1 Tax=Streptomyces flavofungini TaxID=68200 RepID=UPI00339D8573
MSKVAGIGRQGGPPQGLGEATCINRILDQRTQCNTLPLHRGESFAAEGAEARWVLYREMLLLGPRRHDGLGEVAVWPVGPLSGPALLPVRLRSAEDGAVVETELGVIAEWLGLTQRLVPLGCETSGIRWDDFLLPLLDGS